MSVRGYRLAIAGVIAATAIAGPAAALASGSGSPSGKPASPPVSAASAKRSEAQSQRVPAVVRAFAERLGVSTSAAGPALKQIAALSSKNGGVDPASPAFAAVARGLGVSPARLAAAWDAVKQRVESVPPQAPATSGKKSPLQSQTVPVAVRAFAERLGVSTSAAGPALKQVAALSSKNGGVDRASPAFAAIARGLGVSPARLAAAWDEVAPSVSGK